MKQLPLEEIVNIFDEYLNDNGMWQDFKKYIEEKGYRLEELGMKEDE